MTGASGAVEAAHAGGERSHLHVRVEGRVQGVGFRRFVQREGDALGLAGWVCNVPDGAVEVAADGEVGALARFRERLAAGPPHARVERLRDLPAVPGGGERPFAVRAGPPAAR